MRFGILSTANIARKAFVPSVQASDHEISAVASRDASRAETFADEVGADRAYGSYDALLEDDTIDAIYNPLPNALHAEWTMRAADHGLHVLCEKPLTSDQEEARRVVDHCEDAGITLMEAFMWRYHPRTERAVEIVDEHFDDIREVEARFAFPLRGRPDDVRLDPDLAGGSLMDVGCYAVNTARLFLGDPQRALAVATDSRNAGVDTALSGILEYDDGQMARISCGFDTQEHQRYRVEAVSGWLEVEDAYNPSNAVPSLRYHVDGETHEETFDEVDQFRLEVEHFADCVETGVSPRTSGREAIRNMAVIDALRDTAERGVPVDL